MSVKLLVILVFRYCVKHRVSQPVLRTALVAYFNKPLGPAHSKHWSKFAFSMFFELRSWKNGRKSKKFSKKRVYKFAPKRWSNVLFPEKKQFFSGENMCQHSTSVLVQTKTPVFLLNLVANFVLSLPFSAF